MIYAFLLSAFATLVLYILYTSSELDVWNWMRDMNCRSIAKAVELANAQDKLKEEQQKIREQQRAQAQQASGAAAQPATPLGTNAWTSGMPGSLRPQSAAALGNSAGALSGLSAMVQQFEAVQNQIADARTAATVPPPLMSVNIMDSSVEPAQQQGTAAPTENDGDEVVMSDVYSQQSPVEAMLMGGEVFYCRFCANCFNASDKWNEHCASEGHRFNIYSDRDRCWNFRQPPWHLNPNQYKLCVQHCGDPNNDGDPGNAYVVTHTT